MIKILKFAAVALVLGMVSITAQAQPRERGFHRPPPRHSYYHRPFHRPPHFRNRDYRR